MLFTPRQSSTTLARETGSKCIWEERSPSLPQKLISADEVVKKQPKLRGDNKMGKLAVALARECYFSADVMTASSVSGKGPGTNPLPDEG